jgi:hypothetical protein
MLTKSETYPILDLMLKAFMEGELKWFAFDKIEAMDELDSIKIRINNKIYKDRVSRYEIKRKYKRLEKWKKEFPFHRMKRLYTRFIVSFNTWLIKECHIQFNLDSLTLKIVDNIWSSDYKDINSKPIPLFNKLDNYLEITDNDYNNIITLLYMISEESVVQNIEDIPRLELRL